MRSSSQLIVLALASACDATLWQRAGGRADLAQRQAASPEIGSALSFLRQDKLLGHVPWCDERTRAGRADPRSSDVNANICAEIESDPTRSKKRLMAACAPARCCCRAA